MRKEYLDEFCDEAIYCVPNDFPRSKQFYDVEFYDYFAVNRWFKKHAKKLRHIECEDCIHYTPEILEQTCQHDPETFDPIKCPHVLTSR